MRSSPTGRSTGSGSSSTRPDRLRRDARRLFAFDRGLGSALVAGCDEAGRGCLAGPLVAAAVLFDHRRLSRADRRALAGLNDSKQRDTDERERLYPVILRAAVRVAVIARSAPQIDARGLHVTNLDALRGSLNRVWVQEAICLVDGFRLPDPAPPHRALKGGDSTSAAVAAASIVAKVTRDRYMRRADSAFPGWGFADHVGYSTPEHRAAILEHGTCALHRRSFASVAYPQLTLADHRDHSVQISSDG